MWPAPEITSIVSISMKLGYIPLALIFFLSLAVQAAQIPVPLENSLVQLRSGPPNPLPTQIHLLVWNVHKGSSGNDWAKDLNTLSQDKHLILLEEGVQDSWMPSILNGLMNFGWMMARSFFMKTDHNATGVITGASSEPLTSLALQSPDTEPLLHTPKTSLFTYYLLQDQSTLLVVNIHGINFRLLSSFKRHIDQVTHVLGQWPGKIIFAGDFNSWSAGRTDYLRTQTKNLGLREIRWALDPRVLQLDHIFYRGCRLERAVLHNMTESSDHFPLSAQFDCRSI